jgi:hypothetical protein
MPKKAPIRGGVSFDAIFPSRDLLSVVIGNIIYRVSLDHLLPVLVIGRGIERGILLDGQRVLVLVLKCVIFFIINVLSHEAGPPA